MRLLFCYTVSALLTWTLATSQPNVSSPQQPVGPIRLSVQIPIDMGVVFNNPDIPQLLPPQQITLVVPQPPHQPNVDDSSSGDILSEWADFLEPVQSWTTIQVVYSTDPASQGIVFIYAGIALFILVVLGLTATGCFINRRVLLSRFTKANLVADSMLSIQMEAGHYRNMSDPELLNHNKVDYIPPPFVPSPSASSTEFAAEAASSSTDFVQ